MVVVGAALDSTVLKVIHLLYGERTYVNMQYVHVHAFVLVSLEKTTVLQTPNRTEPNQANLMCPTVQHNLLKR